MQTIQLGKIYGLAQDFLTSPSIFIKNAEGYLVYDFETESGEYSQRRIYFDEIKDYRHILEENVTPEMIDAAYNSIAQIIDSDWISKDLLTNGFKHFLIYFDGYGTYEFIAKDFRMET